jgi:hypothetical protein
MSAQDTQALQVVRRAYEALGKKIDKDFSFSFRRDRPCEANGFQRPGGSITAILNDVSKLTLQNAGELIDQLKGLGLRKDALDGPDLGR